MVDYRIHVAALEAFREQLALSNMPDPTVSFLRDQHVSDADQSPEHALLGSMIDLLIWHASSDGQELELLGKVSALWQAGREIYAGIGEFRLHLENGLQDPSNLPALQGLNNATTALQGFAQQLTEYDLQLKSLKMEIAKLHHLRPHPRQLDKTLSNWSWGDVLLARRTDVFTREMRRQAADTETSAFAFGVLSSYGANAAGAAYLGQVVGGPRRSHRYRTRVASNTIGSWVGQNDPFAPTLEQLAQRLKQAFPTGLPDAVEHQIQVSLEKAYDLGATPALPDLQLGYTRLLVHLELLASFRIPEAPPAPREPFLTKLFGDPANPYVPSMPEGTGLVESGSPVGNGGSNPGSVLPQNVGRDDGPDHSEPPPTTEAKCGAFWEAVWWSLIFLLGGWIACVIRWQDGDRCALWDDITQNWEEAFPDGAQGAVEVSSSGFSALTSSDLANIAQAEQILQFVGDMHNLQSLMWEGFNKAQDFLAVYGLVYPDGLLERWRYSQYLSVPQAEPGDWPRLDDTGVRFDEYPTSAVEQPAVFAFGYPTGSTPAAVLARVPHVEFRSAADICESLWLQMANDDVDSSNLDLDADRGWLHPCWTADGSITEQPINVRVLTYDET
ncbi:hypothetical protein RWA06_25980 (plasmid) [Sinorhizobium meliloti]|uniref:hypothetical protein n=1 Tax=Rhizobium meliloti TaxID=382 RepID=UPI00299E3C70|nr:hypothetical protein [Sinorhizobium meliloti]MDX0227268.1 hypothetical protein [Sinorhizobium meliloti]